MVDAGERVAQIAAPDPPQCPREAAARLYPDTVIDAGKSLMCFYCEEYHIPKLRGDLLLLCYLLSVGHSEHKIARETGIPRSRIRVLLTELREMLQPPVGTPFGRQRYTTTAPPGAGHKTG